ncbi:MAG: DNA polymerase IV [Treponema sp.]|nr:DNA polymerase IV [Treponema sp.]
MEKIQHWYLHVDLDAFFASVEQLDHPEYRGKPVIVGGKPEDRRSVVSTASYEARKYGVHSAMPTAQAYKLCPHGIYVYGRMERYSQISYGIMEILKNYSPDVDQMSIDEAFLDITGMERLFGTPQEIAAQIKKEIFEKTGLTVSVGIAQSKYHAKIASDMKKPDGLYIVQPGTEKEFMLNLPLKKVFGLGTKTLERLNGCGIKTTRDIYEKPLETLQFMFGENQGSFLYNVVRGKFDDDRFGKEAKSHSISAETTFPYDVNDSYALETVILNLAYSIMFRLLKEKGFSRTAMIKIRYEDFSTVSIRQTFDKNISTLDHFYEILKNLFEKKWEVNRGVRLIGVGLENIEKEERPSQQELFDDGTDKKQKVEKAILNMSQKHPELKVHKARMLQNMKNGFRLIICSLFLSSLFGVQKLNAQTKDEKKDELFKYEISGSAEVAVSGAINSSFGNGTDFVISPSLPVFTQKIDLAGDFSFGSSWLFSINFADNFNKNTYSINYTGENYLKKFQFSNRDVVFPQNYLSLQSGYNPGGGNNEAPGIILNWQDKTNQKFFADALLRYDMTKSGSATFYGKNKVSDITTDAAQYSKNRFFTIPSSQIISQIKDIYVYTKKKTSDTVTINGENYKKLDKSEYLISSAKCFLAISSAAFDSTLENQTKIIVTFENPSAMTDLDSILGTYDNASSFLGKTQKYFSKEYKNINLSDYAYDYNITVEEKNALLLQNNKGFSPFAIASAYNLGAETNSDISVINGITFQELPEYSVITSAQDFTQLAEDFFNEKNTNVLIFPSDKNETDFTEPENRFPFANVSPYLYLTGKNSESLKILKRSLSPVTNFDIGRNIDNNSIAININGLPVYNFEYSSTSGFVTINQKVSDTDRIDITWREQAATTDSGTITTGAGFAYNFTPKFSADVTVTAKIPFTPFIKYSTENSNHSNYIALSSGLKYEKDNFVIKDTASVAFENSNTTDVYVVNQNENGGNQTYYHSQSAMCETQIIPIIPSLPLSAESKGKLQEKKGEADLEITGNKLPVVWNFESDQNWTSMDIKLSVPESLSNINELELAVKKESTEDLSGYKVFLQLGVPYNNTNQNLEENYPVWELSQLDLSEAQNNQWQILVLPVTPIQQALLTNEKNGRIIIYKGSSSQTSGKISIGPYELKKDGIVVKSSDKIQVSSTFVQANNSPAYEKYFSSKSYNDLITWNTDETAFTDNESLITADSYFHAAQFSDYSRINFDFAFSSFSEPSSSVSDSTGLTFILDNSGTKQTAIKIELSNMVLKNYIALTNALENKTEYHTLTVDVKENLLYIDNTLIPESEYSLYINSLIAPNHQQLIININQKDLLIQKGTFICGKLYYTQTNYKLNLKNIFETSYKKETIFTNKNEEPVLYNGYVNLKSQVSEVIPLSQAQNHAPYSDLYFDGGISLLKTDIATHLLISLSKEKSLSLENTGYSIKTNAPLFDFITFEENFIYNLNDSQVKKDDSITMDFLAYSVPVNISFNTSAEQQNQKFKQKYAGNLKFDIPIGKTKLSSATSINLTQKETDESYTLQLSNAAVSWADIFLYQFSNGSSNSTQRTSSINTNLAYKISNNINPQLSFTLSGTTDKNQMQALSTVSSFNLTVPFKIKNNSFSFTYSKKANNTQENTALFNYGEDLFELFRNQSDLSWFYNSIPFYELFDSNQAQKLQNTPGVSSAYNSKYEFTWKRPLAASIKDLFIPVSFTTSLTRDTITSSNINDVYQLKAVMNHFFVNLLGSKGKLKLFNWFSQDEFNSSISAQLKIPASRSNVTWKITSSQALLCYMDNKNTVRSSLDFNISGKDNWQLVFGGTWSHNGTESLLIALRAKFVDPEKDVAREIIRKEILNVSFGKINGMSKQEYRFTHSTATSFGKQFTVNSSLGTAFIYTQEKALNLNLEYSIGVKLTF